MISEIRVDDDILLRWPTMADGEDVFGLVDSNREHLGRWLPWVEAVRAVEDERRWVEGCMEAQAAGASLPFLIVYQGAIAGSISINRVNRLNNTCEIGYWLAQDLQGRGIVTLSCSALIDYAFGFMGMNRVEIRVMPENKRSLAISERLGFVLEGVLRETELLYGRYRDLRLYSMLASQWANTVAPSGSLAQTNS